MSHFEYISVALALINALIVSRLLNGLIPSFSSGARYPIHFAWVVTLILITVLQWWAFWRANGVEWTAFRFLWALSLPAILFLRVGVLLGERPEEVTSFKDHFFESRVRFFSLGLIAAFLIGLTPWVLGTTPWFSVEPLHASIIVLAVLSIAGMLLKEARAQGVIVLLIFLSTLLGFAWLPVTP
jgi:hypothetical protein